MGLESATYLSDLVNTNPGGSDYIFQGDDHLRLLKSVLQNVFKKSDGTSVWDTAVTVNPSDVSFGFVPVGGIIMWGGSIVSLPSNWKLCDGTSGTPDLRDKFIVGSGNTYTTGDIGGSLTTNPTVDIGTVGSTILTINQIPSHDHFAINTDAVLNSGSSLNGPYLCFNNTVGTGANYKMAGSNTLPTVGNVSLTGGGLGHDHTLTMNAHTHATVPPYYALAFIKRIS